MGLRVLPRTRWGWLRLSLLVVALPVLFLFIWVATAKLPGPAREGPLPPLTNDQAALAARLRAHVVALASTIGERSDTTYPAVERAAAYVDSVLRSEGYTVAAQRYRARGRWYRNLEVTIPGRERSDEIVVVGGHYDTAVGAPGADDNASGIAAVLELSRAFAGAKSPRTVRFLAFANEEPPSFPGPDMGSRHYADAAAGRGDRIVAMLALESLGYYDPAPGTQRYPFPLNLAYPDRGDFVAFVSNWRSRPLLNRTIAIFRAQSAIPSQGGAAPWWVPGIWWSDHWAFWRHGWSAVMLSATAPYRNPFYHTKQDTPDKLDYARLALVVDGVAFVLRDLLER